LVNYRFASFKAAKKFKNFIMERETAVSRNFIKYKLKFVSRLVEINQFFNK